MLEMTFLGADGGPGKGKSGSEIFSLRMLENGSNKGTEISKYKTLITKLFWLFPVEIPAVFH